MNRRSKEYMMSKNAVRAAIRKSFTRSDYYKDFVDLHRIEWKDGNRKRVSYPCNICSEKYPLPQMNVDHIYPIGKGVYNDLRDAEEFHKLVFCPYDNLQMICKDCHKVKSAAERKQPSFDNASF